MPPLPLFLLALDFALDCSPSGDMPWVERLQEARPHLSHRYRKRLVREMERLETLASLLAEEVLTGDLPLPQGAKVLMLNCSSLDEERARRVLLQTMTHRRKK